MPVDEPFVPENFIAPSGLTTEKFVLRPLRPEHNERDYDAWTSSVDQIRSTPGFGGRDWPQEMTPDDNRRDLERHAHDFEERVGFTFTVLDPAGAEIIGCVYLYPSDRPDVDVEVRSWVRASHADLDVPLHAAVTGWLTSSWPWTAVEYAPRPSGQEATMASGSPQP